MKFFKINDKVIRCVLHNDELARQDVRIEDMLVGKPNAREFLNEIIIQACTELDMELSGQNLSVHMMPMSGNRLDLLISEITDPNNLAHLAGFDHETDSHLEQNPDIGGLHSKHTPGAALPAQPPEPPIISDILNKNQFFVVYRFEEFEPVVQFAKRICGEYCKKSFLFKDPLNACYYLSMYEKRKRFRGLTDLAGEYGSLYSMEPIMQSSLKEHYETILKKNAVEILANL